MTINDLTQKILLRPLHLVKEPYEIPAIDWLDVKTELEEKIGYPLLSDSTGRPNFLLCGVPIMPSLSGE